MPRQKLLKCFLIIKKIQQAYYDTKNTWKELFGTRVSFLDDFDKNGKEFREKEIPNRFRKKGVSEQEINEYLDDIRTGNNRDAYSYAFKEWIDSNPDIKRQYNNKLNMAESNHLKAEKAFVDAVNDTIGEQTVNDLLNNYGIKSYEVRNSIYELLDKMSKE